MTRKPKVDLGPCLCCNVAYKDMQSSQLVWRFEEFAGVLCFDCWAIYDTSDERFNLVSEFRKSNDITPYPQRRE